jgi:hypothetical protein
MKSETLIQLKVADQVWIATALLHLENPERTDFSKQEIRARAEQEDAEGAKRPGISQHISTHCVASKPPNPARHRMLTRTGTGRRRLFRYGDKFHPQRENGNITPNREDLPERYQHLLDWYEAQYDRNASAPMGKSKPEGATAETLMKLMGRISREDADEMIRIIDECCGRVDANEW